MWGPFSMANNLWLAVAAKYAKQVQQAREDIVKGDIERDRFSLRPWKTQAGVTSW